MPKLHFVVNLRNLTVDPVFRRRLQPSGYLAAPSALTAALRRAAMAVAGRGELLIADNGLFDDIGRITKSLAAQAGGRRAATGRRVARLAQQAGQRADALIPLFTLSDRLALRPTAVIGREDVTAALWIRLGIDGALSRTHRNELRRRNRVVARAAAREAATVPDAVAYLPVASALGYDTAYDAGREFAAAGLKSVACGFGAYMADDRSVSSVVIRGRVRKLPGLLPQRYLRTALAARGFWDGWRDEAGSAPKTFHFLGLGAPIMIPIVALAARATPLLTFDATSPIRDAVEGFLYVSRPACLKIRAWNVAERLASSPAERWQCPCPFCRAFVRVQPFDYKSGAAWYSRQTRRSLTPASLRGSAPLARAYPLLSQPAKNPLRSLVEQVRIGHNHWVLNEICEAASIARNLQNHVTASVEAYARESRGTQFVAAVNLALQIANGKY